MTEAEDDPEGYVVEVKFSHLFRGKGQEVSSAIGLRKGVRGLEHDLKALRGMAFILAAKLAGEVETRGWKHACTEPRKQPPPGDSMKAPLQFKSVPRPDAPFKRWVTPEGSRALARDGDQLDGWVEWTPELGPWPTDGDSGEGSPL